MIYSSGKTEGFSYARTITHKLAVTVTHNRLHIQGLVVLSTFWVGASTFNAFNGFTRLQLSNRTIQFRTHHTPHQRFCQLEPSSSNIFRQGLMEILDA